MTEKIDKKRKSAKIIINILPCFVLFSNLRYTLCSCFCRNSRKFLRTSIFGLRVKDRNFSGEKENLGDQASNTKSLRFSLKCAVLFQLRFLNCLINYTCWSWINSCDLLRFDHITLKNSLRRPRQKIFKKSSFNMCEL